MSKKLEKNDFVSLTTSLQRMSEDDTTQPNQYVDIYKNLYDLITPSDAVEFGVKEVSLSEDKNSIVVKYTDNTIVNLDLSEKYLKRVNYISASNSLGFIFEDSNEPRLTVKLDELTEQYVSKAEFEELVLTKLQDRFDNINNKINELGTKVESLESGLTNVQDSIIGLDNNFTNIQSNVENNSEAIAQIQLYFETIQNKVDGIENNIVEVVKEQIDTILNEGIEVDNVLWQEF